METTTTPARKALTNHIATGTTGQLVGSLLILNESKANETHNLATCAIIEEICRRFPEVCTALDAWEFDMSDNAPTMIEATVAAIPMAAL
jgi:hypothetical protein